jgi:hypothetical protein
MNKIGKSQIHKRKDRLFMYMHESSQKMYLKEVVKFGAYMSFYQGENINIVKDSK